MNDHGRREPTCRFGQALRHRTVCGVDYVDARSTWKDTMMRARTGDTLVVPGSHTRTGLIVSVVGPNGAPPYVVKWLADGHIAMVTPDQYSRIVPAARGLAQIPLADQ
jgi:Domain of unknown function (DUF1918)